MSNISQKTAAANNALLDPRAVYRSEFEAWIGHDFNVPVADDETLSLRLEEVQSSPYRGIERSNGEGAYSLIFSGPTDRYFKQATVSLEFPDGRTCALFAVNNGPRDDRMYYQIIFN